MLVYFLRISSLNLIFFTKTISVECYIYLIAAYSTVQTPNEFCKDKKVKDYFRGASTSTSTYASTSARTTAPYRNIYNFDPNEPVFNEKENDGSKDENECEENNDWNDNINNEDSNENE